VKQFVKIIFNPLIVHFTSILSVYGMVPHLTAVMGTMLPMLGMAKHENMRWVFSAGKTLFTCTAM